jgi:transposase
LATTHIISRAVYPASELKTVSWIKENSSVCELTGYDIEKVTKDKLYEISKKLYLEKSGLENHLSRCTNELFNLQDQIILYDLTNTNFEGRMKNSKKAQFGRSKEKRSDAKLIVLAVIINTEGFLKYSDIFEGNTSDCSTLQTVITKLNKKAGYIYTKPIIVMDAGIATEANIQFLKNEKYDYLCVSRSNLKEYKTKTGCIPVQIHYKKNQPIELLSVRVENDTDNYLWVKSEAKALKENSMHGQFMQRFEEGLRAIQNGIASKGGTKKKDKVWERIGQNIPPSTNATKLPFPIMAKALLPVLYSRKNQSL